MDRTFEEYLKDKLSTLPEKRTTELITMFSKMLGAARKEVKNYKKGDKFHIMDYSNDSAYWNLVYDLVKPGDIIMINSPKQKKTHKKRLVVTKKHSQAIQGIKKSLGVNIRTNPTIKCSDRNGATWNLHPSWVVPLNEKMEPVEVHEGSLVCISDKKYCPGYKDDTIFRVVWLAQKYVRVVPINPIYEIDTARKIGYNPNGDRPGDGLFNIVLLIKKEVGKRTAITKTSPSTNLSPPKEGDTTGRCWML